MSDFKKYRCLKCGHIYDEAEGCSESGIAAGTRWADIPEDWLCPECGAVKDLFELMA
jgi:rubredoxin